MSFQSIRKVVSGSKLGHCPSVLGLFFAVVAAMLVSMVARSETWSVSNVGSVEIWDDVLELSSLRKFDASAASRMAAQVLIAPRNPVPSDPCVSEKVPSVLVILENQMLFLCEGRRTVEQYPISIGSGGYYKSRAGDRKTPVGIYELRARNSPSYGSVLHVGYPNADQLDQPGSRPTGSLILVHGPSFNMKNDFETLHDHIVAEVGPIEGEKIFSQAMERMKHDGLASVNWTAGCIAVASGAELGKVTDFVKDRPGTKLIVATAY